MMIATATYEVPTTCYTSRTYISSLILQMMKLEVKSLAQEDSQHEVESGFKPRLPESSPLDGLSRASPGGGTGLAFEFGGHHQLNFSVRGTWVAPLANCWTLDFGLGHDLIVGEFELRMGLCADSAEPAWDSLTPSLSLSASPLLAPYGMLSVFHNK